VGLSECTVDELERAHAIMPITAIQMEWSLQSRDIEKSIVPAARKLGIGIVAYSPLGRGFLSRTFRAKEEVQDWRKTLPRFSDENFEKNNKMCDQFEEYAKKKGYSAAQLALAWVHARGKDVFPIPGTKSSKRIVENAFAASISLTNEECEEIEALIPQAEGDRYDPKGMERSFNGRI